MAALEFVRNVKLAKRARPVQLQFAQLLGDTPDNTKQAFVTAGSVTSFTDRLKGQQKRDVLNSTLFAQLAADYKYDRENPAWYDYYVKVMGEIGYVLQGFSFTKYEGRGESFTMDTVVLDILAALATDDELAVLNSTIGAFKAMADDDNCVALFDHFSKHLTNGGFEIFPCTTDSNNDVVLSLGAFYFNSQQNGTDILFFRYSTSSTSFYKSSQKCVLNMDVYDQICDEILKKLGDQAKTDVANIPI